MKKNTPLLLSEKIKALMKEANINQAQLAAKAKINKSTLNGYLNGVTPKNIISLKRIALFFNISLDELIFNEKTSTSHFEDKEFKKFEIIIKSIK